MGDTQHVTVNTRGYLAFEEALAIGMQLILHDAGDGAGRKFRHPCLIAADQSLLNV